MRIALPAEISLAAFAGRDAAAAVTDLAGETMGTRWTVRCVLPASITAESVRDAIVVRLDGLVAEMSHWSTDSVLSEFNRSPAGHWTALPPDFAYVIEHALAISAQTHGAFDPAIGRLVDIWGFGPIAEPAPPTAEAIEDIRALSGWRRLILIDGRLRQPGGLSLDLSGIAKGHAVDAVADLLGRMGIAHCLVEIGGELAGRGVRPDGQPWWVDLEIPPGAGLPPLRIALHGLAIATSGNYRRGAHTLDPRTGRPITNAVTSTTVIHLCALAADAWATALGVLGPAKAMAMATEAGIAGRIVTMRAGRTREYLTPKMTAMLIENW